MFFFPFILLQIIEFFSKFLKNQKIFCFYDFENVDFPMIYLKYFHKFRKSAPTFKILQNLLENRRAKYSSSLNSGSKKPKMTEKESRNALGLSNASKTESPEINGFEFPVFCFIFFLFFDFFL